MAGYIGTQAVSVNTTSATISDDLSVGDDLTVTDDATIGGTLGVTGITDFGSYQGSSVNSPVNIKSDSNHFALSLEENSGTETWQLGIDADGDLNFHNSGGGTPAVTFSDGNNVGIGTVTPTGAKTVITHTADAKALLIGKSSAMTAIYSSFLTGQSNTAVEISGTAAAGAGGPALVLSNNTVNASGCGLGGITFAGATSGSDKRGGIIGCATTANSSSNITADMFFFTNHAGTLSKKLNIGSAGDVTLNTGNLVIGTNGKGIDFTANTTDGSDTSELLDDYEEGTFTPGFIDNSGRGAAAMAVATGFYTKIGRMVHVHGYAVINGLGSMNGLVIFTGLPFSAVNVTNGFGAISITQAQGLATTAGHNIGMTTSPNSPNMSIRIFDSTIGTSDLTHTELSADGGFIFGGSYHVT